MRKYKFSNIRNKDIPEDCNKFLKDFAGKIASADMIARIIEIEKKHLFGTLCVIDATGFLVAECGFRDGVCPMAMLEMPNPGTPIKGPFTVRFRMSQKNMMIFMDKPEKADIHE